MAAAALWPYSAESFFEIPEARGVGGRSGIPFLHEYAQSSAAGKF